MKNLIQYFLDRSFLVNLVSVFLILIGGILAVGLRRDLIPPMDFKTLQITLELPGASSLQVERFVTVPVEQSLQGLPGIENVSSSSNNQFSNISLELKADADVESLMSEVRGRVMGIRGDLPDTIKEPIVRQMKNDSAYFMYLGVLGVDVRNPVDREHVIQIERKFAELPGIVSAANSLPKRRLVVRYNPAKIERSGFSISELNSLIRSKISVLPVAQISKGSHEISVELSGHVNDLSELREQIIRSRRSGTVLRLQDVAKIDYEFENSQRLDLFFEKSYIAIHVRKDLYTDIIDLKNKAEVLVPQLQQSLPEHLTLRVMGSGPGFVEQQLKVLGINAAIGLFFVLILLSLLLGMRVAFMTALGIPLAYLGTAIVLYTLNISIDLISLIAMILIIGVIVDDAIIVSEKYAANLSSGMNRYQAAFDAAWSLLPPVTATILTTMIAFSPILFVEGHLAVIFFAIPVVIITALAVSWFESFFILPNHLAHFVPRVKSHEKFDRIVGGTYEFLLVRALRFRYVVLLLVLGLTAGTVYIWKNKIESRFWLNIGAREVNVVGVVAGESSVEKTLEKITPLLDELRADLDPALIEGVYTRIARVWADGRFYESPQYFKLSVALNETLTNPNKAEDKIKEVVRAKIEKFKDAGFERLSMESGVEGQEHRKDRMYSLYYFGEATVAYEDLLVSTRKAVESSLGFVDLVADPDTMQTSWRFVPDETALLRYELSPVVFSSMLRNLLNFEDLGQIQKGVERTPVAAILGNGGDDMELAQMASLEVPSPVGTVVPLSYLGKWQSAAGLKTWERKNGKRSLKFDIKYDPEVVNDQDFKKSLESVLPILQKEFPFYSVQLEQADLEAQKNKAWMLKVVLTCVIGILFVLMLQLNSVTQPFIVGLAIPFGFIGTIWAIYFHGYHLELMAMIGLLGVAGVAVNDAIIMVDQMNRLGGSSKLTRNNILIGARSRLRAITLTTVTTLGGLFPMAYSWGGDSGFTRPLAFSMAWGLAFSTLLTLFVLPILMEVRSDVLSIFSKPGRLLRKAYLRLYGRFYGFANPITEDHKGEALG